MVRYYNIFLQKARILLLAGPLIVLFAAFDSSPSAHASMEFQPPASKQSDKEAILTVIQNESNAFWNKDFEEYASYWVQSEYIRTLGWWKAGGVTVVEGWKDRSERTRSHMEVSPAPNPTANKVRRENINLRIYDDVAWMTFDQYGDDTGDELMDMPGLSRETRILEKHNGEWKIAYVGWLLEGE